MAPPDINSCPGFCPHLHFILLSSSLYVVNSTLETLEEVPFFERRHERYYLTTQTVAHVTESGLLEQAMKAMSAFETNDAFFRRPMILTDRYFSDEYFLESLLSPEGYEIEELSQFMHWDRYMDCRYYQFLVCTAPGDVRNRTATHLSQQLRSLFSASPVLVESRQVTVFFAGNQKQLLQYLSEGKKKGMLFFMEDHYFQMIMQAMLDDPFSSAEKLFYYECALRCLYQES